MKLVCLLAFVAVASATDLSDLSPAEVAIFKAVSSTSYSTSYTFEKTKITIVKHATGAAVNTVTGGAISAPEIVVVDAAKRGKVCVPRSQLNTESEKVVAVGQGSDTVVAVGGAASSSSAAAASGGAVSSSSAAAAGGGAAATATSSDGAAAGVEQYAPACKAPAECTPIHLCDDEGYIIESGEGVIDIRTYTSEKRPPGECRQDETCCTLRELEEQTGAITWVPDTCGVRAPVELGAIDERILGRPLEDQTELGEFPWMVALLKRQDGGLVFVCGGSLVRPDVVLTSAHCVYGQGDYDLVVRAGEWDTITDDPDYPHVDVDVAARILHEAYNPDSLWNDVALLRLASPVQLAAHINTICLPSGDSLDHLDLSDCVATGWGKNSFEDGAYQSKLKKVQLSVVDRDVCQDALRLTRLGQHFKLHESFTCAGGEPQVDTCKGDGGGGLMCRVADSYDKMEQVGIVAWGIGCGRQGVPGVYADVKYLLPWIKDHMPGGY